jgi:hypothetical protein
MRPFQFETSPFGNASRDRSAGGARLSAEGSSVVAELAYGKALDVERDAPKHDA